MNKTSVEKQLTRAQVVIRYTHIRDALRFYPFLGRGLSYEDL